MSSSLTKQVDRFGITLTEVVVGTALLGGVLTVILVSTGQLQRVNKRAKEQLSAVELVDRLAAEFMAGGFPILGASGAIGEDGLWSWDLKGVATLPGLVQSQIVAIEVRSTASNRHAARIELLIPKQAVGTRR